MIYCIETDSNKIHRNDIKFQTYHHRQGNVWSFHLIVCENNTKII